MAATHPFAMSTGAPECCKARWGVFLSGTRELEKQEGQLHTVKTGLIELSVWGEEAEKEIELALEHVSKALEGLFKAHDSLTGKITALQRVYLIMAVASLSVMTFGRGYAWVDDAGVLVVVCVVLGLLVNVFGLTLGSLKPLPMDGSDWADFAGHEHIYGSERAGMLLFLIDVYSLKVDEMQQCNKSLARDMRISVWFAIGIVAVALVLALCLGAIQIPGANPAQGLPSSLG